MILKYKINRFLEKKVLLKADLCLVVGDDIRKATLDSFNFIDDKKVVTITNGFDPDDYESIEYNIKPTISPINKIRTGSSSETSLLKELFTSLS